MVWRSKKSRCEIETIPVVIRPESWTHIAVVFRPVDEDNIDDILGMRLLIFSHFLNNEICYRTNTYE